MLKALQPVEILRVGMSCSTLQSAASEEALWRDLCQALWAKKVYVPAAIRHMSSAQQRSKRAYFLAIADSKRTVITMEEMCRFDWSFRFAKIAGEDWTR